MFYSGRPIASVWVIRGVGVSENICDNTMKQQNKFFHNECIQERLAYLHTAHSAAFTVCCQVPRRCIFLLRERRWAISGCFLCSNRKCPRKTNQTDEKYSSTATSRMNGEIHYYCSVKLLSGWCKTPVISVLEPFTGTEGCPEHSGGERLILCAVAFRILPLVYLK